MQEVMKGVRVLEVAQYTFVPAAGAVLADWGADVLKIEHPERGDGQRGLLRVAGQDNAGAINFLMEHSNRGKRSIGLDMSRPDGLEILYELVRSSDVFLTNFLLRPATCRPQRCCLASRRSTGCQASKSCHGRDRGAGSWESERV